VWRAEHGGFKIEYAALVILAATVITAMFAFGLPTDVRVLYAEGICRIMPEHEDCAPEGEGSDQETGGDGPPESAASDTPEDGGASPSPSPSDGADSGDEFDPELSAAYYDALDGVEETQNDLDDAEAELEEAGYDEAYDAVLELIGDIIGYNDAKACLTEGDIMACIWTVVGFTPWGKGAKLVKNAPKIIKLWNRFRKAKKAREAVQKRIDDLKKKLGEKNGKVDDAVNDCLGEGGRKNSFAAGTPVLMADGSLLAIEDVSVGDEVLSFDPLTGEEGPREVTDLIRGDGHTELVEIGTAGADGGTGTLTATAGHPFWLPESAEWSDASRLTAGTELRTAEGRWAPVASAETRRVEPQEVFNLTVEGLHTYYVQAPGGPAVLVHNDDPKDPGPACELPEDSRPGVGDKPKRVSNSNMPHAAERADERIPEYKGDQKKAREDLKDLGKKIEKEGFPEGTIPDTARKDRVLVPFGSNGYAVYQIKPNGAATLKTVLIRE